MPPSPAVSPIFSIITTVHMDRASQVLAQSLPPGVPRTWAALSERSGVPLTTLYYRAHRRQSIKEKAQGQQYLTPEEEKALVTFLLLKSDLGQPVRVKYIPSLAFNIARQRSIVATDNPIKPPNKNWPRAFGKRNLELKARRVRAIDWKRHENNMYVKITHWFEVIDRVIQDPAILRENVYNMDETGVMLSMLGSVKVLVGKDGLRNYRGAGVKRTMVTAIECVSADGRSLPPLIIWPASTHRSNWTMYSTPGWHYAHSENGYNDSKISLEWLTRVFDPQTNGIANQRPRVLICDGFGTHETLEVLEFCFENNILLCRLPSHTSHKLQPCDVGVFAPLKTAYRDEVERLYQGGLDTIGKEHFTSLYKPARKRTITKRNIMAGWAATGLFPFNPERVLRHTPKPPAELTVPSANEVMSCPQDQVPQTPITPVTPVTIEALTSLHNLIEQELDEQSKDSIQRHVQKLASAAKISFAKQTLFQDQNRLLSKMNKEAKVRRSTRSVVLGKAKVMSYEDLEEARAKRAAKEKATAGKVKRGPKRKSPTPESKLEAQAGSPEVMTNPSVPKDKVAGMGEVEPAKTLEAPWRAPVARMY